MRNPDAFNCDVCGRLRGATNHWLVLLVTSFDGHLVIAEWDRAVAEAEGAKHACGNSCTQKLVERWLALKTLDAPRAAGGAA